MKWLQLLASLIGLGFWGWLGLAVLGTTGTSAIIFFPLGIFPFIIAIGFVLLLTADDKLQKKLEVR